MRVLEPILSGLHDRPEADRIVDDQRTWSGWDLRVAAGAVAHQVAAASDRPHIGVMVPTSGLFPAAAIGIWMLGRTVVPLNYLLSPEELAYVIEHAELDLVLTVGPMAERFAPALGDARTLLMESLEPAAFDDGPIERPDDHLAVLLYTSGTSGRPKGVRLTSGNLASNVQQCCRWVGFGPDDTLLGVLPQFHSFGLTTLTLLPLSVGAKVVYTARFLPRRLIELLRAHRPTVFMAIPSMYAGLLNARSATAEDFASLRIVVSGGEPLPAAVAAGFRDRLDVVINEGYGLTETGPVTNWCRPEDYRPRSVGMCLPDVQEKIVDPNGAPVAAGRDGEICIKGPNIMAGYHRLETETAAVFDDEGYFRTGDMGRFDADGHLYITGRIKEMLIIGGENVFPREIEEVLDAHPSVLASAVIGMPDQSRGEVALAFVEMADGATFDETELRSHCRGSLGQHKVPREIRMLEQLPRNPTGKIMRRALSPDTPGVPVPHA